jgi:hypothetical protein
MSWRDKFCDISDLRKWKRLENISMRDYLFYHARDCYVRQSQVQLQGSPEPANRPQDFDTIVEMNSEPRKLRTTDCQNLQGSFAASADALSSFAQKYSNGNFKSGRKDWI